ncbi:MAG: transcription antitermination factor NusB [Gemmatimonadales bacterium]
MRRVPGLAPRFAAWRILHDVRHGVPFDVALKRALEGFEPDDRRLAHELAAGVFRRRTELDLALDPAIERGVKSVRPDMLDALRIGAFQLLHLDRVPPHAAVQTTVGVVRRIGGRRVAGFVNAVLRQVAERAPSPDPADDAERSPAERLADRHSHPRWLVDRWIARHGIENAERLLVWNNTTPGLALQPARWSAAEVEAALDRAGVAHERIQENGGILVRGRRPTELPGFADGGFYVQDPAQALVIRYADVPAGVLAFDPCAAPGGKALALARSARLVVAADRERRRMSRLRANVERVGQGPIALIVADANRPPLRSADVVLLDAPCLGTGTFARNPDARWRVTERALAMLAEQASGFLDALADLVVPGGLLLFATCSLEPEENAEQVERFLARDPRFRRDPPSTVPSRFLTSVGDLMILPHRDSMDGAYAARLRRAD